ncbi:immunoglobulin-like domain-containing protein, partial [Listeria booriae]|uniref:immunoglobulin-like domain-containing protein n=1 Tax=Listeria booriae TaxID=1552123 RepID=UPI0017B512F7|nr:hypothetical protein [Listeria booriae]
GKYTGDVTRAHLFVNGVEISNGGTFANGNFTYFVRTGAIKAGDNVILRAVDKDGRLLDEQKVNVIVATQGTITPNSYTIGETNITGKYTGDVTRAHLFVNGVEISNGGTFANGNFTYFVRAGVIEAGDNVVLRAVDKNGKLLDEQKVNVIVATQGTITPNSYTIGETNITGKYTGDVARARLTVNGQEVSNGGTFANGNFTYFVRAGAIKAGDNVVLTAFDKNGRQLDTQRVLLNNSQGTINPDSYTPGESNLTGKYTGDVSQLRLTVNGQVVRWGGTLVDGNFDFFVRAGEIKVGDNVVLTAFDQNGRELDRQQVNVSVTQGTITPSIYNIGDSNIVGKYTGDVSQLRLTVNGQVIRWGGTFVDGNFDFFVRAGEIKSGDNVVLTAFDQNGRQLAQQTVVVQVPVRGTVSPDAFIVGSSNITGSYTGDVAKANLTVNGEVVRWGGAFADGNFAFYVGGLDIKAGDTVILTAFSAETKQLDQRSVSVLAN